METKIDVSKLREAVRNELRDQLASGIDTARAELDQPVVESGTRGEYDPEPT